MTTSHRSLIIGAAGQVGHQLVLALGPNNVLCAGRTPRPGWAHLDIADLANNPEPARRIIEDNQINAVYCVGAATDVERCETDPDWAMTTNHLGPAALAALCTHIPFIFYSTEYVFDGVAGPYSETSPTHPISVYGLSKYLGEQAVQQAHPSPLILRTTVVYGQDLQAKNFLYALRRLLRTGTEMRVPSDQISTPTYNRDLAEASILLVAGGHQGIFHVCGPELFSRYDFAVRSAEILQLDPTKIIGIPTSSLNQKAPRPLNAGMLTDKLTQTLPGFRMRDLKAGIQDWIAIDP